LHRFWNQIENADFSANLQAAPEGLVGRGSIHETANQRAGDEVLGGEEFEDLQEQLRRYTAEHARVDLRRHGFPFRLPSPLLPPHTIVLLPLLAATAVATISVRSRVLLPLVLRSITFLLLLLLLRQ